MPMFTVLITKIAHCLCILSVNINFLTPWNFSRIALVYANKFLTLVICSTIPTICCLKLRKNTKVIFISALWINFIICSLFPLVVPYWLRSGKEVQRQPHSTAHPLQRRQELDWHSTLCLHQCTLGHWTEVCVHNDVKKKSKVIFSFDIKTAR